MPKYTEEQVKQFLIDEHKRHSVEFGNARLDVPPEIEVPGKKRYVSTVPCACGFKYEIVTQHSAQTQAGQQALQFALLQDAADHLQDECAKMIVLKYAGTN